MIELKTPPVKFLLVDDREENLVALEALLRRDGLEILKARTGDQALELLLEHDIALALLDVQMPEMDGFALAELMRGSVRSRHVPIIFVTAAVHEQHRAFRGYDAGAVDFLFKPIDARILRHKAGVFFDLHKKRQELAETLRVNEMFVAVVGHDLKTPLGTIMLAADMLLQQALDPKASRHAERIKNSGKRMMGMIEDLFDLARARLGGGIPLERSTTNLAAVARSVVTECATSAAGRTIDVSASGDTEGNWDARRVHQVITNLVVNAIRHGAPDAPIEVAVTGEGDTASVSVHNGGVIPEEVRSSLFDPFQGAAAGSARKEGLGLGLFIVHQLVTAHGGRVEVDSSETEGTTFRVWLPKR